MVTISFEMSHMDEYKWFDTVTQDFCNYNIKFNYTPLCTSNMPNKKFTLKGTFAKLSSPIKDKEINKITPYPWTLLSGWIHPT